jgi:gamma-glutamyl-gamma-aminobutyrate hydrolase PuuD
MAQPVIGLILDAEPPGGYSKPPWYALRENYCAAVVQWHPEYAISDADRRLFAAFIEAAR